MLNRKISLGIAAAATGGLVLLSLAGCDYDEHEHHHHDVERGVVVGQPAPVYQTTDVDYVATEPPPAAQYEVITPSPGPDYVWISGSWGYSSGHYEWDRGRWDRRPHADARWVESRWEHSDRGWEHHRGYWR